jgi:Jacalin-like lectin domain
MPQIIPAGASGGNGGAYFADDWFFNVNETPVVRKITAYADADYVRSIRFDWTYTQGTTRGGSGGSLYEAVLGDDEFITELHGAHDLYVKWLFVKTNKNEYSFGNMHASGDPSLSTSPVPASSASSRCGDAAATSSMRSAFF